MSRLTTTYLGLELRSPLVASASPLTGKLESARRMQECGAAAVVLPSLFEEEIIHEDSDLVLALEAGSEHFAEALSYFPNLDSYPSTAEYYLSLVRDAKQQLQIPVIASLNAASSGGWVRYAKLIEEAGADALELNLYRVAADPARSGADVEASELDIVNRVSECLRIPLAVKLAPYYSSFANFAAKVTAAGAAGLVLMNRFYQPDLDPDSREVVPSIELSRQWELRLPLRWVAILRSQLTPRASLAITTGVQCGTDAAKALLVGADVAMMTSAILRDGPEHFATVERQLVEWMDTNEYESVSELRGSVSYLATDDPSAFERANYRRTLHSWTTPYHLTPSSPSGRSPV
jgi:dihydroorotate dehydrogenase (fumarate)